MGSVAGVDPLPLLALPGRPMLLPPPPLNPRVRRGGLGRCLLPLLVVLVQVVVAMGVPAQRRVVPGPSGLGSGVQAAPRSNRPRSGLPSLSSSAPLGAAEEDHDSVSGPIDLDRDGSFRSVLHLIREFHGMEEPASVAPNRRKTSLAPIYGLQSESSLALHLPLSPLLGSLLEGTNLALAKFVEDQTVRRFLPVPGRRHRRYYRTSSSSFPGLYTVPP